MGYGYILPITIGLLGSFKSADKMRCSLKSISAIYICLLLPSSYGEVFGT